MNSLPTTNEIHYLEIVKQLDPTLYMIKEALDDTGVNPLIIPKIIRAIGMMGIGTGHGVIHIYMQSKTINNIKYEESIQVNEIAITE